MTDSNTTPPDEPTGGSRPPRRDAPAAVRGDVVYLPLTTTQMATSLDFAECWDRVRHRWKLAALVMVLLAGPAGIYLAVMTPRYLGEVSMIYADGSGANGEAMVEPLNGGRDASTVTSVAPGTEQEAVAVLISRTFTEDFIKERNLLPVLFADDWDAATGKWETGFGKNPPTLLAGYEKFDQKVRTVERDRETGLTTLSITWSHPELAADWANSLIVRLNLHLKDRDRKRAEAKLVYLRDGLLRTNVAEIQGWLYGKIQEQMETIMYCDVTDDYAFVVIDPAAVPEKQVWTPLRRLGLFIVAIVVAAAIAAFVTIAAGATDPRADARA